MTYVASSLAASFSIVIKIKAPNQEQSEPHRDIISAKVHVGMSEST